MLSDKYMVIWSYVGDHFATGSVKLAVLPRVHVVDLQV